jgi:hypothetical protein
MSSFSLWISGAEDPQLSMTEFSHPALSQDVARCVRGKVEGAFQEYGSFQWTRAVKALTILCMYSRLVVDSSQPLLSGEGGSLASSLDYAIGKVPTWLQEMFGTNRSGVSLISRIIERSNPERKRPGPVALSLRRGVDLEIRIYWENQRVEDASTIRSLLERIIFSLPPLERPELSLLADASVGTLTTRRLIEWLRSALQEEARQVLQDRSSFRPTKLRERVEHFSHSERFLHLSGEGISEIQKMSFPIPSARRLGIIHDDPILHRLMTRTSPLRIALSLSQVGALLIFLYLREIKKIPLDIDYRYPHSVGVIDRLAEGSTSIDLVVLTVGPAATVLGRPGSFTPLMMMPSQGYRVLQHHVIKPTGVHDYSGTYFVVSDQSSTAHFWIDGLLQKGVTHTATTEHAEVDEVAEVLLDAGGKGRAVLGFPFHNILTSFGRSSYVGRAALERSFDETFLFFQPASLPDLETRNLLETLMRDAWLTLAEESAVVDGLIDLLLTNSDYIKFVERGIGFALRQG